MNKKRELIDLLLILAERKKELLITFFVVLIVSLVISLILPQWYESKAKILIQSEQGALDIGAFLGNVPIDINPQPAKSLARMEAILKSRQLLDKVIETYNLHEIYGQTYLFETREELLGHMTTELDYNETSLVLYFEYEEDPDLAEEICNFILSTANEIFIDIQSQEARNNRIFVEKLYNEALGRLEIAEDSLRLFQVKYGTYLLDEQLRATIENQAILEQQLIQSKTEYQFMANIVNRDAAKMKELKLRINTLENQLKGLQRNVEDYSILLPLKNVPDQAIQYYKLQREITILGKVLEFLTPQYEKAVIEENRSSPSFVVLDKPVLPEYKSRPKRSLVVLGITGTVMIFFAMYIFIKEYFSHLETIDEQKYVKWKKLFSSLKIRTRRNS